MNWTSDEEYFDEHVPNTDDHSGRGGARRENQTDSRGF